MELKGKFNVLKVLKKTSAVFFKELKAGDEFELRYDFNGTYKGAPSIDIYQNGKYVHCNDALQLRKNLEKFQIEQV